MKVEIGGLSTTGPLELTVGEWQIRAARAKGCEQLLMQVGGGAPFTLELGTLELEEVVLRSGEREIMAARLSAAVSVEAGESPSVRVAQARAEQVSYREPGRSVRVSFVALPQGLTFVEDVVEIPQLDLGEIRAELALVGRGSTPPSTPTSAPSPSPASVPSPTGSAAPAAGAEGAARASALRWLDGLRGQANIDVYVEATYPVYGARKVTHPLRIALEKGALDYRSLEDGLAPLEDAVLDIELEGDALILEKDLPGVPFDNQTLLRWPLDAEELALARVGRVRLSTLTKVERAVSPTPASDAPAKKGTLALHRLELREIDVALGLAGGASWDLGAHGLLRLGSATNPALSTLRVGGALCFVPDGPAEPGELSLGLERAELAVERIPLGARTLSTERLVVGAIDAEGTRLRFSGLRPQSLELAAAGLSLTGARLS